MALDYIELIDQAKTAGVQHFIFISVLGADRAMRMHQFLKVGSGTILANQWLKLHHPASGWISLESPASRTVPANRDLSAHR